jgi:LysM repeat protein
MQYINLNKTLEMENKILDLLLISIDDQIETTDDKEGVKIIGNISISGKTKTQDGEREFNDSINLDVFLTQEEIADRSSLNIMVSDFNYDIEDNKLLLNISLKIEGLKEIETTFLAEENIESIQEKELEDNKIDAQEMEVEIENDKKVYIDIDIDVNERYENEKNNENVNSKEIFEDDDCKVETNEEYIEEIGKDDLSGGGIIFSENNENDVESPKKKSLLKSVFSSRKINEEVSWKLHCVKNESTYEEIANKYNINLNKLISINSNEKLVEGKLIFLPLD